MAARYSDPRAYTYSSRKKNDTAEGVAEKFPRTKIAERCDERKKERSLLLRDIGPAKRRYRSYSLHRATTKKLFLFRLNFDWLRGKNIVVDWNFSTL